MRLIGQMCELVGGLILGVLGIGELADGQMTDAEPPAFNAPVVGGIVVVVGLLLLANGGRRD